MPKLLVIQNKFATYQFLRQTFILPDYSFEQKLCSHWNTETKVKLHIVPCYLQKGFLVSFNKNCHLRNNNLFFVHSYCKKIILSFLYLNTNVLALKTVKLETHI